MKEHDKEWTKTNFFILHCMMNKKSQCMIDISLNKSHGLYCCGNNQIHHSNISHAWVIIECSQSLSLFFFLSLPFIFIFISLKWSSVWLKLTNRVWVVRMQLMIRQNLSRKYQFILIFASGFINISVISSIRWIDKLKRVCTEKFNKENRFQKFYFFCKNIS